MTKTEARALVDRAVAALPNLTTFGLGVYYTHYQRGPEHAARQVAAQQAELYSDRALGMVAACVDWINANPPRTRFNRTCTSYGLSHQVEDARRAAGDMDPYVHNGCFIAAAVGLGLEFRAAGPNVQFKLGGRDVE